MSVILIWMSVGGTRKHLIINPSITNIDPFLDLIYSLFVYMKECGGYMTRLYSLFFF